MHIKGAARRSIRYWARHLLEDEQNTRAELIETRGLAGGTLREMMHEMREYARFTRCKNSMYIASFNPSPGERPAERQWEQMYEIFERQRGIPAGTPLIVVEHEKKARIHRHVIWLRIDTAQLRAFPDGNDAKVCAAAAKQIERELGL